MAHQVQTLGISAGLLAQLIWGAWPVLSKLAMEESLQGTDITALRFTVAGLILLPILFKKQLNLRKVLLYGIPLAIGAGAPYVLLSTSGLSYAPAGHFGIICPSAMLLFTTLGSKYLYNEKLSKAHAMGLILIMMGIIIVGYPSLQSLSTNTLLGDLIFVGCGLLWASYTLGCKYWGIDPLIATALVAVLSMLGYMPLYLSLGWSQLHQSSIQFIVYQALYQGLLAAIVALFFYSTAVKTLGSAKAALFAALVPPMALILGALILDEVISTFELLGVIIVSLGMVIALGGVNYITKILVHPKPSVITKNLF